MRPPLSYRPDVDGLRALAVVPVILYHAGLPGTSGGFLGVDVFFVISGYLITTIIISEIDQKGSFSLANFYERRARRILPALVAMSLMTLIIAPFVLTPDQLKDVGQSVFATAVFASNYFFYWEIDYFNPFASQAPLLHTWSLAVEEQFYLFFPLLLLGAKALGGRYTALILLIFALSLAAAFWTTASDPLLSFYSIHTRGWELAAGSLVAIWKMRPGADDMISARVADIVTLACLVVLVFTFTSFNEDLAHPGLFTVIPVGATALLIALTQPGGITWRILSNKALVHTGLMSYGLYLYHNPLFSFVDAYFDYLGDGTRIYKLSLIPVVYLISLASLHLLERPLRHGKRLARRGVLVVSSIAVLALAGVGAGLHVNNGFKTQIAAYYERQGMPLLVNVQNERAKIEAVRKTVAKPNTPFSCTEDSCHKTLLLGDSMAIDNYLALALHGKKAEYRRVFLDDTCMEPINSLEELESLTECNRRVISFGSLLRDADTIIISAKWQDHTYLAGYNLAMILQEALDAEIIVMGSAMFTDLSSFSIKAWRSNIARDQLDGTFYDYQRWDRLRTSDKLKDRVQSTPDLSWISRNAFFCDNEAQVCRLLDDEGDPMIWDNIHLTTRAFPKYAAFLEGFLSQ